jgi:hypothetical protein
MKRSRTGRLLAAALVAVLAACSDSVTAPSSPLFKALGGPSFAILQGPPPLRSVTPATATVASGGTQQFTPFDTNGVAMLATAVTWSVSGGGTIDATGLFTAGTTAGTFTVSVVDKLFPSTSLVTVSVTVTVASTTCKPHDDRKECENEGDHDGKDHGGKDHGGKDHGGNRHHDRGHGGKNADEGHGGGKNGDGHDRGHGG